MNNPDEPSGNLQAQIGVADFGGPNTNIECVNCERSIEQTFNNVIQIIIDPTYQGLIAPPSTSLAGYSITTSPVVNSLGMTEVKALTASWPIPMDACGTITPPCKAWARVCADYTPPPPSPPPINLTGVVCEVGETNCIGTTSNCSPSYTSFMIAGPPIPPPTGGACKATPGVSKIGNTVTWSVNPGSVQDGTPPLSYEWTSLTPGPENDLTGTTSSIPKVYTTGGTKKAHVKITDAESRILEFDCSGSARIQVFEEF